MFSGERVVVEKERLKRDGKFLLRSGALSWFPKESRDFPLFTRNSPPRDVDGTAEAITEFVMERSKRGPLEVRYAYRHAWEPADERIVVSALHNWCADIYMQLRAYDVSRGLFGLRAVLFPVLLSSGRQILFDIESGITTHLGDGQRFHDGNQWTFSQMKGVRSHTGHLYFRSLLNGADGNRSRNGSTVFR